MTAIKLLHSSSILNRCAETIFLSHVKLNRIPLQSVYQFSIWDTIVAVLKDNDDVERERSLSQTANMFAHRFARCSNEVKLMPVAPSTECIFKIRYLFATFPKQLLRMLHSEKLKKWTISFRFCHSGTKMAGPMAHFAQYEAGFPEVCIIIIIIVL